MNELAASRLDKVATLASGGTPSKADSKFWGGSTPWLTPKDMAEFDGSTQDSVTEIAIGNGTRLAPTGAIFVAVRGMSLHKEIRIIRTDRPMTFNQDIKAIIPKGIDGKYLYYALLSQKPALLGSVEPAGHGTGVLPTDKLSATAIPDRNAKEQEAIATILGALDDKIELNRRMNASLAAAARALFKDWFIDFGPTRAKVAGHVPYLAPDLWALFPDALDGDSRPEGWTAKPLDEVADFLNGVALQKYPPEGNKSLPVIKIAQLRTGSTLSADRASTNIPEAYVVEDGDVLFSWSGSLMHRVWTSGRGALNQHLFKVTSEISPKWFFFHWIDHHMPNFRAIAAAKATTMGHIQRHHLSQASVTEPTAKVMGAADALIGPLFARGIANDLEARTLVNTRDLLLPKLMCGVVRLREAERIVGEAT